MAKARTIEERVRRLVRGQVRSYMNDHPDMFSDKAREHSTSVILGLDKRITNDLLALAVRWREDEGEAGTTTGSPSKDPASVSPGEAAVRLPLRLDALAGHFRSIWRSGK